MPRSDELLDERIRESLQQLRVGPADVATATSTVHRRAAVRVRRQRAALGVGAVALAALIATAAVLIPDDGETRVDTEPSPSTETTALDEYGFAPLTPLLDEPILTTDMIEVTTLGEHTLIVHYELTKLSVALRNALGAGSLSADPMRMAALSSGASSGGTADPDGGFVYGVTRAEVAFVELTFGADDAIRQATLSVEELPMLRFFVFDVGAARLDPEAGGGMWTLAALDADGKLLTDDARIQAEQDAFERAMDERAGVEVRQAGILDAGPSTSTDGLTLRVFACGGEPVPTWTERGDTIEVSVTVKLPAVGGDCTSGDAVEVNIGLDAPLGDRAVVDSRTGEPIPRRT